jgi:spore coat protein A
VPGPTIEVRRNELVKIKWINNLPDKHLLPVDTTIHGAEADKPQVRTVVHVHGGRTKSKYDGQPEAWFTNGYLRRGPHWRQMIYKYSNHQRAATLWYHDHAVGITRLNIYAGLAGFYIIRDAHEDTLNLPRGSYEIPLAIQDKSLNPDGSLFYPRQPSDAIPGVTPDPSVIAEFFGDTILVNGKVWPYLEVEPRKYRLRILNASNARFYSLSLDSGQPFYQIGVEGGLLERPVKVHQILLAPAERADVIVDFKGMEGRNILLNNHAPAPFPSGEPADPDTTGQIMQFRVTVPLSDHDASSIPRNLGRIERLTEEAARQTRYLTLVESKDQYGRPLLLLDGKRWSDPVTETIRAGSTEMWCFVNLTNDTHPIHLHLVHFQIVNRQQFNVEKYLSTGDIVLTGPPMKPDETERGWKDTVRVHPGQVTRIIARFEPYTGNFPWHCHILEHEDNDMMRPFTVISK